MNLAETLYPILHRNSTTIGPFGSGFSFLNGVTTKNGTPVNQNTALNLSAFYNGITILTNDFAKLPKGVFKKTEIGREAQNSHPVNYLISKRPNQYMTSFMFDSMMVKSAILKGNGYAFIERNNTGTPVAIQFIDQDKYPVEVVQYNSKLFYKYNGKTHPAEDILHIPGFSFNGITGISVIAHAAQSLGVNLSSQEFASDYYQDKGIGMGIVTTPKDMTPEAKINYATAISNMLSSKSTKYKTAIIDEAGSFQNVNITPAEAQFLATHKQGIEEVARWLNIPVHKLKSLENTNNSITENLEIQHVQDSIIPWAIKFEQEFTSKLFLEKEINNGLYIKTKDGALLRADKKSQAEWVSKMVQSGVITRNEARAMFELNALEGLYEPLTPVNTQTTSQIEKKLENE